MLGAAETRPNTAASLTGAHKTTRCNTHTHTHLSIQMEPNQIDKELSHSSRRVLHHVCIRGTTFSWRIELWPTWMPNGCWDNYTEGTVVWIITPLQMGNLHFLSSSRIRSGVLHRTCTVYSRFLWYTCLPFKNKQFFFPLSSLLLLLFIDWLLLNHFSFRSVAESP